MPATVGSGIGSELRQLAAAMAVFCAVVASLDGRAADDWTLPGLDFSDAFGDVLPREPPALPTLPGTTVPEQDATAFEPMLTEPADGLGSCLIPLPEVSTCASRSWHYAVVDALAVQRDNQAYYRPLVIDGDTNQTVLATSDLNAAVAGGTRVFYGHRAESGWGWEAGYLGIFGMTATRTLTADETLQLAGPMASDLFIPFADGDQVVAQYDSLIQSAEINLFASCGSGAVNQRCAMNGGCTIDWLGGFRYLFVSERADLTFTCCTSQDPGPFSSSYDVSTSNNLVGGQFGGRASRTWRRWAVDGWAKTGVFANLQSQSQAAIFDPLNPDTPYRDARSSTGVGPAMLADLNLSVAYRLTDVFALRAGYNVIWIGGIALAPNQWDFNNSADAGTRLDPAGGIFLNGLSVGLDAVW